MAAILPPLLTPNLTGGLDLTGAAGGVLGIPLEIGGFFLNQVTAIPNTVTELVNSVVGPDGNLLNIIDPLNLRGTLAPNDTRAGPDGILEPIEFVDPLPYIINLLNPITPPEQRLRDLETFQQNTTLGIALDDSTLYQLLLEFDRQIRQTQGNVFASLGLTDIANLFDPYRLLDTTTTTKAPGGDSTESEKEEEAGDSTTPLPDGGALAYFPKDSLNAGIYFGSKDENGQVSRADATCDPVSKQASIPLAQSTLPVSALPKFWSVEPRSQGIQLIVDPSIQAITEDVAAVVPGGAGQYLHRLIDSWWSILTFDTAQTSSPVFFISFGGTVACPDQQSQGFFIRIPSLTINPNEPYLFYFGATPTSTHPAVSTVPAGNIVDLSSPGAEMTVLGVLDSLSCEITKESTTLLKKVPTLQALVDAGAGITEFFNLTTVKLAETFLELLAAPVEELLGQPQVGLNFWDNINGKVSTSLQGWAAVGVTKDRTFDCRE